MRKCIMVKIWGKPKVQSCRKNVILSKLVDFVNFVEIWGFINFVEIGINMKYASLA